MSNPNNSEIIRQLEKYTPFDEQEENIVPSYKFIGIAFSTYIMIELNKELYIIEVNLQIV